MNELPDWVDAFPDLKYVEDTTWVDMANRATKVVLPPDKEVFREGGECKHYILVLDGTTRVYKAFESGREILLYRVQAGETCSLTTSVLLAGGCYPANAVTETECHAVLIPATDFHMLFEASILFRDYVCKVFGGRIRDLIMLLEAVATRNVNVRLAHCLLSNRSSFGLVEASHRELAFELGTAREVISRHLREFEKNGWVTLSRKNIQLVDTAALQNLENGCR